MVWVGLPGFVLGLGGWQVPGDNDLFFFFGGGGKKELGDDEETMGANSLIIGCHFWAFTVWKRMACSCTASLEF